jgi:hypothetical protein
MSAALSLQAAFLAKQNETPKIDASAKNEQLKSQTFEMSANDNHTFTHSTCSIAK